MATANEMHEMVLFRSGRVSSRRAPGYSDEQISRELTTSMMLFIKSIISPKVNAKKEGFEETEIRAQGLGELLRNAEPTLSSSQTGILPNGYLYDLPADFMYSVLELIKINKNHCLTNTPITAKVYVATHNEYSKNIDNPYKKPFYNKYEGLVWRLVNPREVDFQASIDNASPKRHEILTDGLFVPTSYQLRYLRLPPKIVVDQDTPANQVNCILDESTHDSIIDICVKRIREATERQQVQNIPSVENFE